MTCALQRDAQGRLLCKCPECGDEWMVSTWPKLESDAKAQGWEEAMERVEEIERAAERRIWKEAREMVEFLPETPDDYAKGWQDACKNARYTFDEKIESLK